MNVKTYQVASMFDAVQQIKKEMGSDAVILQSRQVQKRRFGVFPAGTVWEVTAALDDEGSGSIGRGEKIPRNTFAVPSSPTDEWREMKSALAELQWEVRKISKQGEFARVSSGTPNLRSLHQRLLEQEIEEELVGEVVTIVGDELSASALEDYRVVEDSAARRLQSLLSCSGPIDLLPKGARTVFLIGPTGVGKTTTIAKLAAHFALLAKKRVLLVTTDTYRIAALPQLKTYAEIMGLGFEVAYTPVELQKIIQENQDKDLILVDTPGRGQRNEEHLAELKSFVDAIEGKMVYLTVSAATRYRELVDILEKFGSIGFDNLVITKLDETVLYGPIVTLANRFKKPISYMTNGQNVPEDIEEASAVEIVDLLLGRKMEYGSGSSHWAKKSG